jgi:hypothetical protein
MCMTHLQSHDVEAVCPRSQRKVLCYILLSTFVILTACSLITLDTVSCSLFGYFRFRQTIVLGSMLGYLTELRGVFTSEILSIL